MERIDRARARLLDTINNTDCAQRAEITTLVNTLVAVHVGGKRHIDESADSDRLLAAMYLEDAAAAIRPPSARELITAVMTTPSRK